MTDALHSARAHLRCSAQRGQRQVRLLSTRVATFCAGVVAVIAVYPVAAQTTTAVPLVPPSSAPVSPAGRNIPVRQLGRVVSSDTTVLMGVAAVRQLPNGSIIVNDATKRQLVVFDSTLTKYTIIADTSTNSPNSYGFSGAQGGLIPYVGDSSIFIDAQSSAYLVIDANGRFARVMAPTTPFDSYYIASGQFGVADFDPQGRMVYRTQRRANYQQFFSTRDPSGKPSVHLLPDSAPILRTDFDKRTVDTIVMIKGPVQKIAIVSGSNFTTSYEVVNPLPVGDEWTLLPDGTVAIVRGQDYHVDWLSMDGTLTSSPKMPFDWKRISIEEKQAVLDSVKRAYDEAEAKKPPPPPPIPGQTAMPRKPFITVEAKELPDFYPAVRQGQVRADREGNVWILPSTSAAASGGGLIYDVVNRQGEIKERVQLPKGRSLVGFGRNGVIYLGNVISATRSAVERAELLR